MSNIKKVSRLRRKKRVRAKVSGTAQRPRLSVFRSLKGMYIQVIDDENGVTVASASIRGEGKKSQNNIEGAKKAGKVIADKCKKLNIEEVVFDRGGYKYHGKVKAIAESARENGLKF